jgi:D-alanyl-D-alanine dipeptidase
MHISKSYAVFIIVALVFIANTKGYANDVERAFVKAGLVDIHSIDETIIVDLVNSDPDKNYFREDFYGGLNKAYLRKEVAQKLSVAQKYLKSEFPGYSILIMDAARPRSVSKRMYGKMKGTKFEKYVANPRNGSMHNFGIAVDVSLVDASGEKMDMGFSPFYKSNLSIFASYAKLKLFDLSGSQKTNRKLLAGIMKKAGFLPISYEWWHFDGMPKDEVRKKFDIIE